MYNKKAFFYLLFFYMERTVSYIEICLGQPAHTLVVLRLN